MEDDEVARLARQYAPEALKALAELADNSRDPVVKEQAEKALVGWLLRLKELEEDPNTAPELRQELEKLKRRFLSS